MTCQRVRSAARAQRGRALVAALAVTTGLALSADASRAQDYTMKFATLTVNDVQHEFIKMYKPELEKATNNRIKVEIYPAGQLGGAPRQAEGLRLGTIEAATGPAELFVGADPRFQGLAMAGLFKDLAHVRRAILAPQFRQAVSEVANSRGLVLLGMVVYDTQSFVFRTPVTKLADFSGKRIRVLASEGERAQVNALGGAAVPMSLGEVLPALHQGTIDGVNSGIPVFVAFKYYDGATNLLDTHLWAIVTLHLASKIWYDQLPADLKKAVTDVAAKVEPENQKWGAARLGEETNMWKQNGGKIVTLSPEEQAEAERRASAAIVTVIDKSAPLKDFYNKIKAAAATVQ
jgi:TRAP-type C4-dicarboxylate transport system substrate-binding protein